MKNLEFKKAILLGLVFAFFCYSCKQNQFEKLDDVGSIAPKDIISKLKAAGFVIDEGFRPYKNGYLVEGDIFLTVDQITNLETSKGSSPNFRIEHFRTNNLVLGGTPRLITVYMDPAFSTYMHNACITAINRYNAVNLSLRFEKTNSTNADIRIVAIFSQSNLLGSSTFPSSGNPGNNIELNTFYYNNNRTDAATTIAHEIGHAVGFRHTDYMNRGFSCSQNANEGTANIGAVHVPGTPTTPVNGSWMLACSDNRDRPFTIEDVTSLKSIYGNLNFKTYEFESQVAPGKRLDVTSGSTSNGSAVQLYDDLNNVNQRWNLIDVGNGLYEIEPHVAPGKRLDLKGGINANGAQVQIYDYLNNSNQRWRLIDQGNGYYEIEPAAAPGKRLDVKNAVNANGATLQIWDDLNNTQQRWKLVDPMDNSIYYELEPQVAVGKRLDVVSGSTSNGASLQLWDDLNNNQQRWNLIDVGNGYYELAPKNSTSKRLDVVNGSTSNGASLQLWDDLNNTHQRWKLINVGNGYYELEPQVAPGKRLDVKNGSTSNGATLQLWENLDNTHQRWKLIPAN